MVQEMERVKTGQITYAVWDTTIDGMEIHQGDIMGIGDNGMLSVGKTIGKTAVETLKAMIDEESELVSIYYGAEVKPEDAQALLLAWLDHAPESVTELRVIHGYNRGTLLRDMVRGGLAHPLIKRKLPALNPGETRLMLGRKRRG